jgi:hypothetical protein
MVMLGNASDMARYWSAPLDARTGPLLPTADGRTLSELTLAGHPSESYLGLQFCRSLGRAATGTLIDSWAFYRDLFAVVDNDWFDLLWLKNLSFPDEALRGHLRELVTHAFWQRLQCTSPGDLVEDPGLNPAAVAASALAGVTE